MADNGCVSCSVGTLGYFAPEVLNGEKWCEMIDEYALGVVMYQMVAGTVPFDQTNWKNRDAPANERFSPELNFSEGKWAIFSSSGRRVAERLLRNDPSKRVATIEILARSSWFDK